jgi:hypothetical protein
MNLRVKGMDRTIAIVIFMALFISMPATGQELAQESTTPSETAIPAKDESSPAHASETGSTPEVHSSPPVKLTLSLETGYREDDLDWNIAGNIYGNNPNILSELTWKDLESHQLKLSGTVNIKNQIILAGSAAYGMIYEGKNQDSDYLGDNRTLEFSRSNNSSDDGDLWDLSMGIGPRFDFGLAYFSLAPMAGYSYHKQNLKITDGNQTIDTTPPINLGPFSGLDSSYKTVWQGPWLGVNLELNAMQPLWIFREVRFHVGFEYHWTNYYAEADWNLRDVFKHPKSFEHDASGYGLVWTMDARFFLSEQWSLSLSYDYHQWETDEGTDRVFLSDGTTAVTRLNRVRWSGRVLSLGVAFHF